jgi:hypothetical protein
MKANPRLVLGILAAAFLFPVFVPTASAQEDELNMALEMNERRVKGLKELAEKIKNFGFLKVGQDVLGKLDSRDQAEDPFGLAMDPEDELPEVEGSSEPMVEGEEETVIRTSLQEALTKLSITGAFPGRKQIMIGAQELGVGDEIVIDYKETVFSLNILKITSSELVLKDRDTQEEASIPIGFSNALPEGMSRQVPSTTVEDKAREESTIVPMSSRAVKVE